MVVVIDNSILVPLFLEDEDSAVAEEIFQREELELYAPELLLAEFGNVMLVCLRRGRLTDREVHEAHEALNESGLEFCGIPSLHQREQTHDLAVKNQLSYYDATYLALTLGKKGKLATLDKALQKAAEAEKVAYL